MWVIHALMVAGFLLYLLSLAYLGKFSRFMADDFCTTTVVLKEGLLTGIADWYFHWTGRYTFNTLISLVGLAGVQIIPWMPFLILVLWFIALTWMLYQLLTVLRADAPLRAACVFAGPILYAAISGTSSITQSLFWAGGMLLYTSPLVWLTFYIGYVIFLLRRFGDKPLPLTAFILTALGMFVVGGLSEIYAVLQIAVLGLLMLLIRYLTPRSINRRATLLLLIGLAFACLASVILMIAPGNALRQPSFGQPLPFPQNILQIFLMSARMIATAIAVHSPVELLVSLFISLIYTAWFCRFNLPYRLTPNRVRLLLATSTGVSVGLIILCIAPPVYLYPEAPPDRMHIIPQYILVWTAVFWGALIGLRIQQQRAHIPLSRSARAVSLFAITALLGLGPVSATMQSVSLIPTFSTYAKGWDQRDQEIRRLAASGVRDIVVNSLEADISGMAGLDVIAPQPATWMNTCVASYYDVDTIVARENQLSLSSPFLAPEMRRVKKLPINPVISILPMDGFLASAGLSSHLPL
jgi:hypothetical protein